MKRIHIKDSSLEELEEAVTKLQEEIKERRKQINIGDKVIVKDNSYSVKVAEGKFNSGREIMDKIEEHFENISIGQFEFNLEKARGEESGSMKIIRNDKRNKTEIENLNIGDIFIKLNNEPVIVTRHGQDEVVGLNLDTMILEDYYNGTEVQPVKAKIIIEN